LIDDEVSRLLKEADERASTILEEHRSVLDRLTALLIQRETIDGAEVYELAGRPTPEGTERAMAPDRAAAVGDGDRGSKAP
jgi:ATP-dependent Zn protease